MRCTAPQLLDDRQNCRETIRLLVEQSTKAELHSLTNGLPSRTNVCTGRKRTCGPQGGSPGLTDAVEKVPNCFATNFPPKDEITRRSFVDMPPGQLPKSRASSSLYDASPHTFIGSPRLRLGDFFDSIDPTEKLGPAPFMDAAHRAYWDCRNSIDSRHGPT